MIFDKVKEKIEEKYITTGKTSDLLPSERELAKEFSVSRPTVRKALATLEQEERIIKSEGRGYILKTKATSEKYIDHELDSFIGFFRMLFNKEERSAQRFSSKQSYQQTQRLVLI
ncbi:winged helix-turn-helix domain-containing protein [Enterococcus avium]